MKKIVEIKKLGINGEGIGYIDRKIIFVPWALVNEEVEVEITKETRTYYQGKLLKVIKPSSDRVTPKVKNVETDNMGCTLIHLKYSSQLTYKKEAIRESLRKYTNYDLNKVIFKDVIGCDKTEGYVSSVNLPIVMFKGRVTFGIYQRETKFLTIMTHSFKHDPIINKCLQGLEEILNEYKCKIYSDKFRTGLRFLKVKLIDGKLQLVFITGRDGIKDDVVEAISKLDNVASVYMSVNTTKHQEFDETGYSKLSGLSKLELRHDDTKYLVSVKSVLPENQDMMWKHYATLKNLSKDAKKIISLNCGMGILETMLPQEDIIAIDEKKYHIDDAKANAKYLHIENVKYIYGDIDDKIVTYSKKKTYDTLIINNERFGLSETIKTSIKLAKFDTIIYSCQNHSTMAKDLDQLEKMYNIERIVALDTFVNSPYVTTVVKLVRK